MNAQITKVIYHIESNLDENFDVETLARVAGYSPYHF
ncbi:MAG TPA: AraC family transcriptional regulator, partial [Epsilonproteobacteria bacterium]|nr:AraC family transcriptional regulator [Campylobacterota bacterium]